MFRASREIFFHKEDSVCFKKRKAVKSDVPRASVIIVFAENLVRRDELRLPF